jgi:hypothetical protein
MTTNMVVFVPHGETTLVLGRRRRSDNLLARLRSRKLDAQLAAGRPPEGGRLLAVRAEMLTTPAAREQLAGYWEEVITSTAAPRELGEARLRVAAPEVRAAAADIRGLIEALQAPQPVAVEGVARASELLRDGGGPVYNPRSRRDLARAVRDAENRLSAVTSVE